MGLNRPTRNHSIAQMLLRNFTNDRGYLFILNKQKHKVYKSKPRKAFTENRRFVRFNEDGEQIDYETERMLSEFEGAAAPAIRKIIAAARKKGCPRLSPGERLAWKMFYFTSHMRTPRRSGEILAEITSEQALDEAIHQNIEEIAASPLSKGIRDRNLLRANLKRMAKHNVAADLAAGAPQHIRRELDKRATQVGLVAGVTQEPDTEFIIGSSATAQVDFRNGRNRIRGLWLPISYDVAISITGHPDEEHLLLLDKTEVQKINVASYQESEYVAARSRDLLRLHV